MYFTFCSLPCTTALFADMYRKLAGNCERPQASGQAVVPTTAQNVGQPDDKIIIEQFDNGGCVESMCWGNCAVVDTCLGSVQSILSTVVVSTNGFQSVVFLWSELFFLSVRLDPSFSREDNTEATNPENSDDFRAANASPPSDISRQGLSATITAPAAAEITSN